VSVTAAAAASIASLLTLLVSGSIAVVIVFNSGASSISQDQQLVTPQRAVTPVATCAGSRSSAVTAVACIVCQAYKYRSIYLALISSHMHMHPLIQSWSRAGSRRTGHSAVLWDRGMLIFGGKLSSTISSHHTCFMRTRHEVHKQRDLSCSHVAITSACTAQHDLQRAVLVV
jgi:hypothetical protein